MNLLNKSKEIEIQRVFLKWYKKNKRDLPWRSDNKNLPYPYFIFVSEYMLQQTTVSTVKKRFEEFIQKWPNIDKLASISDTNILSFWSGLGYYSRATNLLKAAKIIKKNFKGAVPKNYKDLITLPGIGDYTAKAIMGIAYNQPVMPQDANIERILSRIYSLKKPISKIKDELKLKSKYYISQKHSTKLIQAFMDYGSIICKPRNPNCNLCLIKIHCLAYKENLQDIIPIKVKTKSSKIKKYTRAYIFYNEKNEILVRTRSSKGMLASMLEVPNDIWVNDKKNLIADSIVNEKSYKMLSKGSIEYSFSHFDLETEVFYIKVKKIIFKNQKWINKKKLNQSSLPTVMKKIVEKAI